VTPSDCTGPACPPPARAARAAADPGRTGTSRPFATPVANGRDTPSFPLHDRERTATGKPGPVAGAEGPAIAPSAPRRVRAQASSGTAPSESSAAPEGETRRTFTIAMPPGLKLLSLNGREHWSERARRTEALKKAAWALALQAKIPRLERVSVVVEYQPPDRRHRDAENTCAASGKAAIDGIVKAGVLEDDECPRYVAGIWCTIGAIYPKGRLVLHLTEVEALAELGGAA